MARHSIGDLKVTADRRYWPRLSQPGINGEQFETIGACRAENQLRRSSTLGAIELGQSLSLFDASAAKRLARGLDKSPLQQHPPQRLSCSLQMRRLRNRLFSQVHRLAATWQGPVSTFTAIKRGWEFKPEDLLNVNVGKLLAGFLSDLNRRGATDADGWLIAFLHGEYETPAGLFRLHLHGIAAGGMISAVRRLRTGAKYRALRGDSVRCRLRVARKPVTNLPYPLTYCFKSYWPWKHVIIGAAGKRRTRRHKRIPEPYHTLALLFLERHSPADFVVLKHLHVARGRLKQTKRQRGASS